MEVYGIIYEIHNKINNKWYVGQTTRRRGFKDRYCFKGEGIERVYNYHKYHEGEKRCNPHLLKSIEKYGFEAFEVFEEVDKAYSKEELDSKEIQRILFRDSVNNGYNRHEGGHTGGFNRKYSDEQIIEVKKLLSDNKYDCKTIEEITGVKVDYIREVRRLHVRRDVCPELNYIIFKDTDEYAREFMENNKDEIERMYFDGLSRKDIFDSFNDIYISSKIKRKMLDLLRILKYRVKNKSVICDCCGKEVIKTNNCQKYCKKCAKVMNRKKSRERTKKSRERTKK